MPITLRYFAALREITGRTSELVELAPDATMADARAWLIQRYPTLAPVLDRCVAARNRTFVDVTTPLVAGDEIAFLPPMAGGK